MNNEDQNSDAARPDQQPWEAAQSGSGQQGQSQSQQFPGEQASQQQDDGMFQGNDDATDAMSGGDQAPGYGDQGMAGQGADRTGGTSVTGEVDADDEDAELPSGDFAGNPDSNR